MKKKIIVQNLLTYDEIYFLRRWWFSYTKQVPGYWTQMLIIWCGNIVGSLSKHRTNALVSWNEKKSHTVKYCFWFYCNMFFSKILSLSATNTHYLISLFNFFSLFSVTFCKQSYTEAYISLFFINISFPWQWRHISFKLSYIGKGKSGKFLWEKDIFNLCHNCKP